MTDVVSAEPLGRDTEQNYDRFIVEALAQGCVWVLESDDGFALCPSEENEAVNVMPFWSQKEFAQEHCVEDWSIYQPVAVDVVEFVDDWLTGMHEDVILIGINWDSEMEGSEVEPLDLLEDIEAEMG